MMLHMPCDAACAARCCIYYMIAINAVVLNMPDGAAYAT